MNLNSLIARAKEMGFEGIEVNYHKTISNTIRVFQRKVMNVESKDSQSFNVRSIYEGKVSKMYFENDRQDVYYVLNHLKQNALVNNSGDSTEIFKGSKEYLKKPSTKSDINDKTMKEKVDLLLELEKKCYEKDSRVANVNYCLYTESISHSKLINSEKLSLSDSEIYAYYTVGVIVKEGDVVKTNFDVLAFNNFSKINVDAFIEKLVQEGIDKLSSVEPVTGKVPVVIRNTAVCQLLEYFSKQFCGDQLKVHLTPYEGKEHTQIANKMVNLIEDPLCTLSLNKQIYDSEGVATSYKKVIENGIFNGFIFDIKNARALNRESTGNATGRGAGFTNLVLQAGDHDLNELMADITEGLLITDVWAFHAGGNVINGVFNLPACGYVIKNGKLAGAIDQVVLSGTFSNILNDVCKIGKDSKWGLGSTIAPSITIKELTVSK